MKYRHSSLCTGGEEPIQAAAPREADFSEESQKGWTAQPGVCLFSQLAEEAGTALRTGPGTGC